MKARVLVLVMALALVLAAPGTLFADSNTGNISQTGDYNEAYISQVGSYDGASITQYGKNMAEIEQVGNNNQADITQGAPGSPVNNFYEPAYHPAGDWVKGAYITQTGSDNAASINEKSSSTYAHINQTGDRNTAFQDIGTYESKANYITFSPHRGVQIDQIGNDNEAGQETVASFGCYGIQDMQVLQQGDSNYADQYSKGGMASVMEIFQVGDMNTSSQYQDGRFSRAHASMVGNSNITEQYQEYTVWSVSGVNQADIDIVGNENEAAQYQRGEYNEARIYQDGHFNNASQKQIGDGNYAFASQIGDNNSIVQIQIGNDHSSTVTQAGNGNVASVTQQTI